MLRNCLPQRESTCLRFSEKDLSCSLKTQFRLGRLAFKMSLLINPIPPEDIFCEREQANGW